MKLLTKTDILKRLESEEEALVIDPLLEKSQIGEVTIDFRLGYDFFVSIFSKYPTIDISKTREIINNHFQFTRRDLGDEFIIYPNQSVITISLEYCALPSNILFEMNTRSSYAKLGLQINSIVQPGFRGCIPFELSNNSNNPVTLIVGSRIVQARLYEINKTNYLDNDRKYRVYVRPQLSKAHEDYDLEILKKMKYLPPCDH